MGKTYRGIYVDVNHSIEICVHESEGVLTTELIVDPKRKDDAGYMHYVDNVQKILKCKYNLNEKSESTGIDVMLGKLRVGTISSYQKFGEIDRESGKYEHLELLTSTEERILSQGSIIDIEKFDVPFDRVRTKTPKTDLHTHLSGALTNENMLDIGKMFNIFIPVSLLKEAGIDVAKYQGVIDIKKQIVNNKVVETPRVRFNYLTPEDVEIYKQKLSIKTNAQETFIAMEDCYRFRDPFVKLKPDYLDKSVKVTDVLKEQLRCLAKHYQETGVEYAELSITDICKEPAEFAKVFDEIMPEIEREFPNVTLRFLGGIPRVLPKSSMRMRNQNLLTIAKSPYISGLDVLAHEVNETDHFKGVIQDCVEYANRNDPNFVIRVHAGESAVHYDNVKQFLKTVKASLVAGMKPPVIRIGHGVHGLDNETLSLCRELGAIIEINMSSNIALNNIDSLKEIEVKRYIDAGVKVVFGTDGHGMYSTDSKQEAILATATGVTPADMDKIIANEEDYIARMHKSSKQKKAASVEEKMQYLISIADRVRKEVLKLSDQKLTIEQIAQIVSEKLGTVGIERIIEVTPEDLRHLLKNGITQLTAENAKKLTTEQREQLTSHMPTMYYKEQYTMNVSTKKVLNAECDAEMDEIKKHKDASISAFENSAKKEDNVKIIGIDGPIPAVPGKKPVFVMGYVGHDWKKLTAEQKQETIMGAVGFIASLDPKKSYIVTTCDTSGFNVVLHDIIKKVNPQILVTGIVDEQQLETMTQQQREWIYQKFDVVKEEKGHMFTYSSKLVNFLKEQDGHMVAFGEGSHLKDHITNMHNNRGKISLFDDGSEKSTKVKFLQGNGYEFYSAGDVASRFGDVAFGQPTLSVTELERFANELAQKYISESQNPNVIKKTFDEELGRGKV